MREELVGLLVCGADGVGVVDFLLVTCKAEQCFYLHYTVAALVHLSKVVAYIGSSGHATYLHSWK